MTHTVEKIGGTSMSAFDAVLENILLRPQFHYQRIFVVSAYGGITDALLECKRTGKPGIYQLVAQRSDQWRMAISDLRERMILINNNLFADPLTRGRADKFIRQRLKSAEECIDNIMNTCRHGQFSLRLYLPQIREFLSSIGEAHSAYNTVLKLKSFGVNAQLIDLSGWNDIQSDGLDEVLADALTHVDLNTTLPIVTGYAHCKEGLMKTFDRGYSEITFSRLACITDASQAIIHKEYHLSSADPRIVGADHVFPMGKTNFDVADQLANLGMEAIHPKAAAGLRNQGIPLKIMNTFEPTHPGTLISQDFQSEKDNIQIIAGRNKVFALHIFDQAMVGSVDNVSFDVMEIITDNKVQLVGKEMNANSITYYLTGSTSSLNNVLYKTEKRYPDARIKGRMVALISAIGSSINTNQALSKGMVALLNADINPIAANASMRNINVQFVVEDDDYQKTIRALHHTFVNQGDMKKMKVA
ncbi:aspartate kinase [Thaumasiovibrio subtropicus]|uniref:aspartate kinase n=1 Tax=Thaumasiovibrio subtropicus TaxID=1891207 RepID=UPI000B356D72|nr:aspartate kinase [Thaumasiovibrio subtropicus]